MNDLPAIMAEAMAKKLIDQANGLALIAEASEAIARHFRPRFEACWQNGSMVDGDTAVKLRFYVIDKEHEAKQWRREEVELREAAAILRRPVGRLDKTGEVG